MMLMVNHIFEHNRRPVAARDLHYGCQSRGRAEGWHSPLIARISLLIKDNSRPRIPRQPLSIANLVWRIQLGQTSVGTDTAGA
jgi:hypothetical protein